MSDISISERFDFIDIALTALALRTTKPDRRALKSRDDLALIKEDYEKLKAEIEILTKDLNCSERAFAFYSMRTNELEKEKSRFREFIRNGVKNGYIAYPDKGDSARDLIDKIMGFVDE